MIEYGTKPSHTCKGEACRLLVVLFFLLFGSVASADGTGNISGTVTDGGGSELEGISVNAYYNGNWWDWAGSTSTGPDGAYAIGGLPDGNYRLEFRDGSGQLAAEFYNDAAGLLTAQDVVVQAGQTTGNIDVALEPGFAHTASVMNIHKPDDSFKTYYSFDPYGFVGTLPDDITAVTVETPDSHAIIDLVWDPVWEEFSKDIGGSPEPGVHTFRATTAAGQLVTSDYQYVVQSIPLPDTATFAPAEGAVVASKTPSFTWAPVDLPGVPLYYRFEVRDAVTGLRVEDGASDRNFAMTSFTLPEGLLAPGGSYEWRVRVTDSDRFVTVQNRANSDWVHFTVPPTLTGHDALPAIDPNKWNAFSWIGGNAFAASVKVIDLDGVAFDGSSHTLTVTAPDGADFPDGAHVKTVGFERPAGPTAGWYELRVDGTPTSGEYTFTVTDLDGNPTTFVDQLDVNPLSGPDKASLTPSNIDHFITATFDNVQVNGQPYETFDLTDIFQLDPAKWKGIERADIVDNKLAFDVRGQVGRVQGRIRFADPEPITSVQADITVTSISDSRAKARIGGALFNDGSNVDVWAAISNDGSHVYYSVYKEWINHQGTYQWEKLQSSNIVDSAVDDIVTVSIAWSEGTKTLTFSANNLTQGFSSSVNYVHSGPVYPAIGKRLELQARINLTTTPTPTFTWDPVAGASRYGVRIYTADNSRTVWKGYTGSESSYTVPPGVLEPNASYRYRVEAWDAPSPMDMDNFTRTPILSRNYYRFNTNSEVTDAPAIDFDSSGVFTYQSAESGIKPGFQVRVHDRQSVPGNISEVKVTFPSGYEESLSADFSSDPYRAIYHTLSSQPVEAGNYIFMVTDNEGHTASIADQLINDPIGFPATDSLTETIGTETIQVSWDAVAEARFYRLEVYNEGGERIYKFPTYTPSASIPRGLLEKGQIYRYRIKTYREFLSQLDGTDTMGNMDNDSSTPLTTLFDPLDTDGDGIIDMIDDDDDDDGMPDAYEEAMGFDPLDSADALLDADDDGESNLDEYMNETDPLDPHSNMHSRHAVISIINMLME